MKSSFSPASHLNRLFGLSTDQLERVIATGVKGRRAEGVFCDVYLQAGTEQSFVFDQGTLKKTECTVVRGAGVRVLVGDKTGYSFTDHVTLTNLLRAARTASTIADYSQMEPGQAIDVTGVKGPHDLYGIDVSPVTVDLADKLALLRAIDSEARAYDKRITNVSVSLGVEDFYVIMANSLGGDMIVDERPLIRLSVSCQAQDGNRRETGSAGGGGRHQFEFFMEGERWKHHARQAAKEAIAMLSAVPAPAGKMDVVLGPGWPGVLIHEAVGHGLEGDFNRKGTSAFARLMGEKVASELCTVVDEGVLPGRRGSLNVDDEGTPTARNVLIEGGVLKGFMQDRQNAGLMGKVSTGNCRRESYRCAPMPRMTNTYLMAAEGRATPPEEIIKSVKFGIYATTFGGGQVNITNGDFTFSARGAYLIEDGELTRPVKGATLIGNGPKALHRVTMVGDDMRLDEGIGTCGKSGQDVPVGVGMPTVRINEVTVGGTGGPQGEVTGPLNNLSRATRGLMAGLFRQNG